MPGFDPYAELHAIREKLPPVKRSSKFTPYRVELIALMDSGARPREMAAWLAERGVIVSAASVSAYLRRHTGRLRLFR